MRGGKKNLRDEVEAKEGRGIGAESEPSTAH